MNIDKERCPVRIHTISGFNKKTVEEMAKNFITQFGWKVYNRGELRTLTTHVYSITLWNTRP